MRKAGCFALAMAIQMATTATIYGQTTLQSGTGFSAVCPKGWHGKTLHPGAIRFINFPDNKWQYSGQFPKDGAAITISDSPPGGHESTNPYGELMWRAQGVGGQIIQSSQDPARVEVIAEGDHYIMAAPEKDGYTFYAFLHYHNGDPQGEAYGHLLSEVIASIKREPGTARPSN